MAFKYKLKEQDRKRTVKPKDVPPSLLKRLEDLYGPVDVKNDFFSSGLNTYFKTTSVNKETGGVSHKPIPLASFEDSLRQVTMAYESLQDLLKSDEAKNDSNIQDVAKDIKLALNKYRAHLRKFYPEQYRQAMSRIDEELEEISTTGGGAGSATFSAGTGMQYATPYAFKKKKKKLKKEDVGATLGPGPKATEDGVKDNAYVKQFKYKLVPKNKQGTYVQKGSGLEVNKLF
jgi:hypothetical protein